MTEEEQFLNEGISYAPPSLGEQLKAAVGGAIGARPTVHTLQAQQEEGERAKRQFAVTPKADIITATKMREALYALLKKAEEATAHAAVIAGSLDGQPPPQQVNRIQPAQNDKVPLFAQFARQVLQISQQIDLIEAQLKRIDAVLS